MTRAEAAEWIWAQVTLDHDGRTLLGDVRAFSHDEKTGTVLLHVFHFNGEPWPVNPSPESVVDLRNPFFWSDSP